MIDAIKLASVAHHGLRLQIVRELGPTISDGDVLVSTVLHLMTQKLGQLREDLEHQRTRAEASEADAREQFKQLGAALAQRDELRLQLGASYRGAKAFESEENQQRTRAEAAEAEVRELRQQLEQRDAQDRIGGGSLTKFSERSAASSACIAAVRSMRAKRGGS